MSLSSIFQITSKSCFPQSCKMMMSTQPQASDRLRYIFEEYRQEHFAQCLPSRFKKEMVQAMLTNSGQNQIELTHLERLLSNIGAKDKITKRELEDVVFQGKAYVDVKHMIKFM